MQRLPQLLFFACLAACANQVEDQATFSDNGSVKPPKCGKKSGVSKGEVLSSEWTEAAHWYSDAVGVVNWVPLAGLLQQPGNVLYFDQSSYIIGSTGGGASRTMIVQLPPQIREGQIYPLHGLPDDRAPLDSCDDHQCPLRANEVFLSGYSNPISVEYDHSRLKGSAHVLSMTPKKIRVRIQIKTRENCEPTSMDETHEFKRCELK